jgi:hypothetical protein
MQDRVRPFRALLQGLDSFGRRQYLELDFPAMSLAVHLFHHRQRSGSGADHKTPALPGYLLLYRERCMSKPITEPLGRFFLALADAATVDHDKKLPGSRAPVKDNATDADKLAAVSKELRALRNQISAVEAENHRLQAQLGGRTDAGSHDATSLSAANAAAVREEPQLVEETPRLSQ